MNPSEAAQLLGHCAAFDNRTVGKTDARAWAAALHDIPADSDAFDAVARYYATPPAKPGERLWMQPHDVRTNRQAIRNARLNGFRYEPQPNDDNPHTYIANYKAQHTAVAAGDRPANPGDAPKLEGGPHLTVALALAPAGREVPGEDEPAHNRRVRTGPLTVPCPTCRAPLGRHCRSAGRPRTSAHTARRRAANDTHGLPAEHPDEIAARKAAAAEALARLAPEDRQRLDAFRAQLHDEAS